MSAGQSDKVGDALGLVLQMARLNPEMPIEEAVQAFRANFVIIPRADYVREIEQIGEWQARARRVINAANALINHSVYDADPAALAVLQNALVNTDFREGSDE